MQNKMAKEDKNITSYATQLFSIFKIINIECSLRSGTNKATSAMVK